MPRWVAWTGYAALGVQWVFMLVVGTRLYDHFDLTGDFSVYAQAFYLIAHGHLGAPMTVIGPFGFAKNHLELAMWPLSLLYWLHPSAVDLKWVQETAQVGAELVCFRWVLDVLERHDERRLPRAALALGFVTLLLVNPGFYLADWFDFHFQALATFFLVLAARDLYNGRRRRALVWIVLTLLNGDVAATYVVALGVTAAVTSRPNRRIGAVIAVAGVAWLEMVSLLGANIGSNIAGGLGYLATVAPGHPISMTDVIWGMIRHPSRPLHMLHLRWRLAFHNLQAGGVIGILSPWVVFVALATSVPNALQLNDVFITFAFQNLVVLLLVPVGTVMVLEWLLQRQPRRPAGIRGGGPSHSRPGRAAAVAAGVLGAFVLVSSLAYSLPKLDGARHEFAVVPPAAAATLAQARAMIPQDAQVIASQGVAGGFATRQYMSVWWSNLQPFILYGRPVYFVISTAGAQTTPGFVVVAARDTVRNQLHARTLLDRNGVTLLRWTPPRGAVSIQLPVQPGQPQMNP